MSYNDWCCYKYSLFPFCHVVFIVDRKRDPLSYFSLQREAFQTCRLTFALFIADKWWQQMRLRISGLLNYGCERGPTQRLLQREVHMQQHPMQSKNTVHHKCNDVKKVNVLVTREPQYCNCGFIVTTVSTTT